MADGKEYKRIPVKIGEVIPAPEDNPVKYGYDFIDWHPNVGGDDGAIMDTDGATFDAIFEPKTSTITFDTADGTEIPSITGKFGTEVVAPTTIPEREGYKFLRWNVAIPETMPAENLTITAQWTVNQYTITFDTDGGSEIAPLENVTPYADFTDVAAPTKPGYTFVGWDVRGNMELPATYPAESTTYTAIWALNVTVSFNTDGGTEIAPIDGVAGEPFDAAAIAKIEDVAEIFAYSL
mgnify:CR=1 FL=1